MSQLVAALALLADRMSGIERLSHARTPRNDAKCRGNSTPNHPASNLHGNSRGRQNRDTNKTCSRGRSRSRLRNSSLTGRSPAAHKPSNHLNVCAPRRYASLVGKRPQASVTARSRQARCTLNSHSRGPARRGFFVAPVVSSFTGLFGAAALFASIAPTTTRILRMLLVDAARSAASPPPPRSH